MNNCAYCRMKLNKENHVFSLIMYKPRKEGMNGVWYYLCSLDCLQKLAKGIAK